MVKGGKTMEKRVYVTSTTLSSETLVRCWNVSNQK
jgi:hypothetical protein